jgi:hypothetical protein
VVQSYAAQTAARGAAVLTVDALNMMLVAMLVFLIMRQVMPISAALSGGLALSSFGFVSGAIRMGLRQSVSAALPAVRHAAPRVAWTARYVFRKADAGIDALSQGWRRRR